MAGFTELQLGQLRPANTTAASIYTVGASTIGVSKQIIITNVSNNTAKYRVFLDNSGSTYDETTSIAWDVSLPKGSYDVIDVWQPLAATGTVGVRTSIASALNFTVSGGEIDLS